MALASPGVEVTIIDQSQYLSPTSSSIPLLLVATAQNKTNAAGTGVAAATTAANANKLYTVTSQRDLVNLFGNPFFYKTTNGTAIHGYELNEYGLMAAYSLLGATNRCYILRADIDLSQLVGSLNRPTGDPDSGTYWLNTVNSQWGIYEFNASTGNFSNKTPYVLVDSSDIVDGYPKDTIGNIGDYAVIPVQATANPIGEYTYFYKTKNNLWAALGSQEWAASIPTVVSQAPLSPMTVGKKFYISNLNGANNELTVSSGSIAQQINSLVTQINSFGIDAISAENIGNKLVIYVSNPQGKSLPTPYITLVNDGSDDTALSELGLDAKNYYQPETFYGTSAEMPLWTESQTEPHPTGSVWIKTSTAGNGMNIALSRFNGSTASWVSQSVGKYYATYRATFALDSTGGKNIPEGTIIATYREDYPIMLFSRGMTGRTTVTGSVTSTGNLYSSGNLITVAASRPGDLNFDNYTFTTSGTTIESFVQDWQAENILNTTISINTDGAIVIEHNLGGEIVLHDYSVSGQSSGVLAALGLTVSSNESANLGNYYPYNYTNSNATQTSVTRNGSVLAPSIVNYPSNFTGTITNYDAKYSRGAITSPGTNYQVGDLVKISGALLAGNTPANDLTVIVTSVNVSGGVTGYEIYTGTAKENYMTDISNWLKLTYIPNEGAPATLPTNGTYWYYSTATQVDIMVQKNNNWIGYRNTNYDSNGHPAATGSNQTDPNGVIFSTTAPKTQSDGTSLVYGDLWLDNSDLENYPKLYRWQSVDSLDQWVLIDTADQTSSNGILFADARWGTSGGSGMDPVNDPIPSTTSMLTSNYLDLDAPDPSMYPQGMLLFNTRRSGYNVKKFTTNYFTSSNYPNSSLPNYSYTWVSASGLKSNGAAYMGRKAQRNLVVQSMKEAISTNTQIREEDTFFNLIACPNYPELQSSMVTLNNDRNQTAYIVGDTPLRLPDSGTQIERWATNAAGAETTGEDGLVTRNEYLGIYYPSGITSDLSGTQVVVPASHMMLRTILRNDNIAYPWLAPAGTRRGNIDNADNIGYIDSTTGEFVTVKNRMSIRDVLYINQVNPLTYFTGVGLLNYGNKNSFDTQSALNRTNVARLIAYIRYNVQIAARPFVFEPNDQLTRQELTGVIETLFIDLVAKRGLYDYLVVCDETNNTPARIDRNELWVDIAIKPVKAAEFIYIPVRVLNTGDAMAIV